MVVDSSDVDVSESHSGSEEDALNAESGDYGFVWTTDDSEATNRNATNQTDHATAEPSADAAADSQFEWNDSDTQWSHDDAPPDSEPNENTSDGTNRARSSADTSVKDPRRDMNSDGGETVISGTFSSTDDTDGPDEHVSIDPIDYPVDELRTIADCEDVDVVSPESETEVHGFVWSEPPEGHRTHVEDPTPEQRQRLFAIAGIDSERVGEKPYLTTLTPEDTEAFITGWLEFLTIEAGTQGAIDALERYREAGWMTEPVAEKLEDRLQWIDRRDGNGFETFDRGDHLLNFAYVAKIASLSAKGMVFY